MKEISFVGHASFFLQRTLAAVVCNWGWLLKGQEKEEWGGGGDAVKALGRKSLVIAILEKTYGEQEPVCKAGRSGGIYTETTCFIRGKNTTTELERVSKQAQKHQRTSQV